MSNLGKMWALTFWPYASLPLLFPTIYILLLHPAHAALWIDSIPYSFSVQFVGHSMPSCNTSCSLSRRVGHPLVFLFSNHCAIISPLLLPITVLLFHPQVPHFSWWCFCKSFHLLLWGTLWGKVTSADLLQWFRNKFHLELLARCSALLEL